MLLLNAAIYATPGYPVETKLPNTCICCTGTDACCHAPWRDYNCNFRKTDTKCSKDRHCANMSKPPHGSNPNGAFNGCKCQPTDRPWAAGRRLGAKDVIEHAESNCTIAASKPTPMVILSLGHSGSMVTATHANFSYFELFKAPEPQVVEAWRRLLRFLGVAAWEVTLDDVVGASDLVETTPYAQAETVLNYEEVAARLAPTAYAHLLH